MNARWLVFMHLNRATAVPGIPSTRLVANCDARELFVGVSWMNFARHMSLERGIHFALFARCDGAVSIVTKLLQEPFDGTGEAKRSAWANGHSACWTVFTV
ncbi:hypothetical protein [Paraburkholderia xenovorans]|uniref:hypothetical protein n=1 Tax=Paraburkholderia xenovorans TaxID=36873 RepID=UPI0038B6CE84